MQNIKNIDWRIFSIITGISKRSCIFVLLTIQARLKGYKISKVFLLSKHPSSCHRVIFLKCKTYHFTHLFKIPQWHPLTYRIKSDRLRMTQAPWWYRNSPFLKYEFLFCTPSSLILQFIPNDGMFFSMLML